MSNKIKIPTYNDEIVWCTTPLMKDQYIWVESGNHPFNCWLKINDLVRYSTIVKYEFLSHDGTKKYEVFTEDLIEIMRHMQNGEIAGSFEYVKHGPQYGIRLVHPATN